jgi:hypothetical protein
MVMTVVFPVPPVPMISSIVGALIPDVITPVMGTLIPHTGLANYHRWSCHDYWRRLDNHGLRSPYHYWGRGDHDRHRQSQPNGDMEASSVRIERQGKACDTQ